MLNSELTDEQLVPLILNQDKELFAELVRRYQVKLAHYLRKFIRRDDQLDDVLQDVFIKAYRNLYGFDVRRKFSPWIYRIAHNEALNYLKKHSHELIDLDDEELEIVDEKADIKEDLDSAIFKQKIEQALSALSDKYREPFILYFFEERSYEEISDILRIPRSTVGVLIMRAKKNLKEYFSQK